jgi:hypothetical protein
MLFRRAYDGDYLDFSIEKTLSEWNANALKLGSPEDFFSTPLAKAYGISDKSPNPSPGDSPSVPAEPKPAEPMPAEPMPAEPMPAESPEPPKADSSSSSSSTISPTAPARPPALENPGS